MKTILFDSLLVMVLAKLLLVGAEFNISCDSDTAHQCDDGSCIDYDFVCDGEPDCPDGSDEKENITIDDDLAPCTRIYDYRMDVMCFIPRKYLCDGHPHCLEDECDCESSFRCSDDQCVPENYFCDGEIDCFNDADEIVHRNNMTGHVGCQTVWSLQQCSLPSDKICDGIPNCVFNEDECFCSGSRGDTGVFDSEVIFDTDCFRCLDGNGGISQIYMCDGYFQCSDLSDECLCENPISTCEQLEYGGDCEFRCLPDQFNATHCIDKMQVCDGTRDCFVGEDEKYCMATNRMLEISSAFYGTEEKPEFWCCNADYPADCLYPYTFTNATDDGCDQFYECPEGDELEKMKYAIKCDGVYSCSDYSDECNEDCAIDGNLPPLCKDEPGMATFKCPGSREEHYMPEMCDGDPTCDRDLGPESFDEKDCPDRYYCKALKWHDVHVNIPKTGVCDCFHDCIDGSDEANCMSHGDLFCCSTGEEGFPRGKVCDGIADCFDESDECQSCVASPFADDGYIIKSKPLQAFVWITGTTSVTGNIFMIANAAKHLTVPGNSRLRITNTIQLIGLAIADCSVGVYLLSVGIVNAVYSGEYCYVDHSWRSGNACNAMGVVSTVGIEASVFMLTTITASRLYTVTRPFSTPPRVRRTILFLALVYAAALTLALVPIFSSAKDYFVGTIRLTKNPFIQRIVNREEFSQFANKLASYGNEKLDISATLGKVDDLHSWEVLYKVIKQLNDTFEPRFEFGFYSTHGVCLPKFFPDSVDSSWHYSLLLVTLNFASFIFILVSYVIIFKKRQQSVSDAGQNADLTSLQRKITRIIVTDFMCWIPICIIAFLKFAGVQISGDVYEVAAIIILPINSALNPFLYSQLPDMLWIALNSMGRSLKGLRESDSQAGISHRPLAMTDIPTVTQN